MATSNDDKIKLYCDTVARPMICDRWALMNRQETGLASQAFIFASLDEIVTRFDVRIGERGEDRFGEFVRVYRADVNVAELRDAPIPAHVCHENVVDGHCKVCGEKRRELQKAVRR